MKTRSVLLLALIALAFTSRAEDAFDVLNSRSSGVSTPLRNVAFGAGVYVTVGDGGAILTSTDTITWVSRLSGTTNRLNSVKYGTNGFVAVGAGTPGTPSTILSSIDGVTWVQRTSPVTNQLTAICYGSGRYVAVGTKGMTVTSTNGLDWASINTHAPYDLNGVEAGKLWSGSTLSQWSDIFVAVGDAGTILTSPDGLAWTARFSGIFARLTAVSFAPIPCQADVNLPDQMFIAVGESGTVATSGDGLTWTVQTSSTTSNLFAVANDSNGRSGAVGEGGVFLTATNGVGWKAEPVDTTNHLYGLVYANGNFLAVGSGGAVQGGIAWIPRNSGTTQLLSGVCYGNGTFVAVGSQGVIVTSKDGIDWINRDSGSTNNLAAVCFGSDLFVAVGDGTILTSKDGSQWQSQIIGNTNSLTTVAYGNGAYVGFGSYVVGLNTTAPALFRSSDGANWAGPYSWPPTWGTHFGGYTKTPVTFGNNVFVAEWGSELVASSVDGLSWVTHDAGVAYGYGLTTVAYGNGYFVGVAFLYAVSTSPDGISWTAQNSKVYSSDSMTSPSDSMTYGNQGFVAAARYGYCGFGKEIATSADGVSWTPRTMDTDILNSGPWNIAFGNGSYVAVGDAGRIRQSIPVNARAPSSPQFTIIASGTNVVLSWPTNSIGLNLQCATNLTSPVWTTISTVPVLINGQNTVTNPISGKQQFFRLSQ